MHLSSFAVVVLAGLALAGCYVTRDPVFSPETAVALFGEGGTFSVQKREEPTGAWTPDDPVRLQRRTDGGYDFAKLGAGGAPGETIRVGFHPAGPRSFFAQSFQGPLEYGYAVVLESDGGYLVRPLSCPESNRALAADLGVDPVGVLCAIDRVREKTGFLAAAALAPGKEFLIRRTAP